MNTDKKLQRNVNYVIRGIILLSIITCLSCGYMASARTLDDELHEVVGPVYEETSSKDKEMRLNEFEYSCKALLQKYNKPEEQVKIYYQLASTYAQTGLVIPNKTIEYARKALEYPLEPLKVVLLYIYWGDAIQVAHRGVHGQELVTARREAVMPYLEGLKETLKYDLPEVKPELPVISVFNYDGPTDTDEYRNMIRKQKEQVEAREKAKFQCDMIQYRDTLIGQINFLYTRFPFATTELEGLLKQTLGDKHKPRIDKIIQKVADDINSRLKKEIDSIIEKDMPK